MNMTNISAKSLAMWQLSRNHGFQWLGARLTYEAKVRSGFLERRFRQRQWRNDEFAHWLKPGVPTDLAGFAEFRRMHRPSFLMAPENRVKYGKVLGKLMGQTGRQTLEDEAQKISQGYFRYFFDQSGDLGFPPNWHANPFTSQKTSPVAHWSRIPTFSAATGDLKFIWEAGRFASAYTLSRAYWVSGNESYAETFWQLLESWAAANPPNHGAHWRCGQETALRIMAWCFAYYAFADSLATTPERLAQLVGMVAAQADRIEGDHAYAHLQKNNHGISEGMGLWTVGILFPELAKAERWREQGRKILYAEAERQIYSDGAYIQHSTNYHRAILQNYTWAIRLGELNGCELSQTLRARVRQSAEFLYQLQDKVSGHTPNYGNNDGSLILPLNGCAYQDFRPVLGAAHYLFNKTRLYQPGPWDEDLVWYFGADALEAPYEPVEQRALQAPIGGYYTLGDKNSWGMIRCATFQDRPAQADMLHLDIWRHGVNIACDPGTYLYYGEPPWDNSLVTTLVHNTVAVDGTDQMARGPRFMWLTWLKSQMHHHLVSENGRLGYFEGSHDGYSHLPQPVTHRRAVVQADSDIWIVIDDLTGEGEHNFRLHWLLADLPFEVNTAQKQLVLTLDKQSQDKPGSNKVSPDKQEYSLTVDVCLPSAPVSVEFDVLRGDSGSVPRGWQSKFYGKCQPAISLALDVSATTPCRFVSVFAPKATQQTQSSATGSATVQNAVHQLSISAEQICFVNKELKLTANLLAPGATSIVKDLLLDKESRQEHLIVR